MNKILKMKSHGVQIALTIKVSWQTTMLVRVRLRFQSAPLHYAQKCWFTFDKEQCKIVGDVAYLISSQFGFSSHKNELQVNE